MESWTVSLVWLFTSWPSNITETKKEENVLERPLEPPGSICLKYILGLSSVFSHLELIGNSSQISGPGLTSVTRMKNVTLTGFLHILVHSVYSLTPLV